MALAMLPTLPKTSIGASSDRLVPRWLRALGSLSDEIAKSACANSPEFSLLAKTPAGRSIRDHAICSPRRGRRIRRTDSVRAACASTRAAAACSSGLACPARASASASVTGTSSGRGQGGSAEGRPEAQREDYARHLHLSPPARRARRASIDGRFPSRARATRLLHTASQIRITVGSAIL